MEGLWHQFHMALKNYNETTEERKNAFEALKSKDEKSASEIDMQMRKLQRIAVSYNLVCEKSGKLCNMYIVNGVFSC